MEKEYWSEFTHLVFLALAISFFVISFKLFAKIGLSKVPLPGLQEAVAAS